MYHHHHWVQTKLHGISVKRYHLRLQIHEFNFQTRLIIAFLSFFFDLPDDFIDGMSTLVQAMA